MIPSGIVVHGVDVLLVMDEPRLHFFQAVRLLADRCDVVDSHVSPLQQTDGLLCAQPTVRIGALRFWMIFVRLKDIAVGLHARRASIAVMTLRRDAESLRVVIWDG